MFNCKIYNEYLTKKRNYTVKYNIKINPYLNHETTKIVFDFIDDNVKLVFKMVKNKSNRFVKLQILYAKTYNCVRKIQFFSFNPISKLKRTSLSQECIPYFWNIGFNGYNLVRPCKDYPDIKNDTFGLMPTLVNITRFMRKTIKINT